MSATRTSSSKDGFPSLGLSDALVAAVTALGYEEPTPVQRETIPLMLAGLDLLAQAATGTGKTAAFALPMIQRLTDRGGSEAAAGSESDRRPSAGGKGPASDGKGGVSDARSTAARAAGLHVDTPRLIGRKPAPTGVAAQRRRGTGGLVLVPTRELAMQVSEAIHKYSRGTALTVVPLYGGASMDQQIRALQRGADIVVATPGRALDHIRRKTLSLDTVRVLVLDEADEMLDMGFAEDIETILKETPGERQTTLFSATLPGRILKIAERHLRNPRRVTIAHEKTATGKMPRVRQVAYIVRRNQKAQTLDRILDIENPTSALVFCRTRLDVDTLVETLNAHGYRAEALHGGMVQRQRDAVMNRVRSAKTDLLIATDVAARGLDIEHLSHVINFDLPTDAESYVHRIGRTGRAGREGTAITLAEPREHRLLRNIEQYTKQKIDVATVPTVADLRAKRLEKTARSLRDQLTAGDFDDVRAVVESLSDEFDMLDIATAAVKLAHKAAGGDGDEQEIAAPAAEPDGTRSRGPASGGARQSLPGAGTGRHERGPRDAKSARRDDGIERIKLFVGAGRIQGIRPGDLVGAITGEAGVPSKALGQIEIADTYSLVAVPEALAEDIIAAMKVANLRGKKVTVRRERGST